MFMIRLWGCLHKKLKLIELYTEMNNMVLNDISMKLLKYVYYIQYPHSEKIGKCIRKMWNLPYRELKMIYVDNAPRRRWGLTLFLTCGTRVVTSFHRGQSGLVRGVTLHGRSR